MKIEELWQNPLKSLQYMERYINDGSPSGFTEKFRTSLPTDPFGNAEYFFLLMFESDANMFDYYGNFDLNHRIANNSFLVHPDMSEHKDLNHLTLFKSDEWRVVPTASARTVQIMDMKSDYIKLYYDGIIGRINRRLPRKKAVNGPEISHMILKAIEFGLLPENLAILHEPFAKIYRNPQIENRDEDWALTWREERPRGRNTQHINVMLPLFSLWSRDRRAPGHVPFFQQFSRIWGSRTDGLVTEKILYGILDIYFSLIIKLGLQDELNAQNILIGFDKDYEPISIVVRDMMGVEKDITIRESLGLDNNFSAISYKVIAKSINPELYIKRHSFAFDFKLSTYVLDPIIVCGHTFGVWDYAKKKQQIKSMAAQFIRSLPDDYFPPKGKWYSHRQELLVDGKIYIENENPMYR